MLIHYKLVTFHTDENGLLISLEMIFCSREVSDILLVQELLSFIIRR